MRTAYIDKYILCTKFMVQASFPIRFIKFPHLNSNSLMLNFSYRVASPYLSTLYLHNIHQIMLMSCFFLMHVHINLIFTNSRCHIYKHMD